ncbi:hypothetical protein P9112_002275 [Eukaryota sp. TZLM1-RC]
MHGTTVKVEFGGGVDEYFDNNTSLQLTLPVNASFSALFSALQSSCSVPVSSFYDNGLQPGYILLVNDTDFEVLEADYKFADNDVVCLISLVHGG